MVNRDPGRRNAGRPNLTRAWRKPGGAGRNELERRRTDRTNVARAAPERKLRLNMIFTDLNLVEGPLEGGPEKPVRESIPGAEKQPEQPRETAGDKR